ncbi:MAG: 2-C-methyl-D-erythritol 2,4-cyclodiphosphate synthase [Ilumatobacter sp.]|jgi:2-C-methyl-D-erythritol 2,4-cyclodiphosphate synthase|uniref:2-C-methyl-D-erythritol 2,4-cyclodiphosphate synthase n=1 Tax=Ilumatobacter sp. TaxID=1967498 RepID=UPI00391B8307
MRIRASAIRVGQGFDVHQFSDDPERRLILAGCHFEGERGLAGHSDADAIAHACSDALLGAAGLGDIGMHFPDTDPTWAGADSMAMLRHVVALVSEDGWTVANIDCAVVCERPKLAPRRDEMQRNLTDAVGAPVTIKGNRAEQLGAIGRGEGIVCFATALLVRERDDERIGPGTVHDEEE